MHRDLAVLVVLGCTLAVGLAFLVLWARLERLHPAPESGRRTRPVDMAIGFVTNFFDTLGIGSFATTTAVYRLRRLVPDELIPGTLNVGHALPTVAQALIFIAAVQVEPVTLISLIVASVVGAWLGAGIVTRLPRRAIQAGMGLALLAAALLFLLTIFEIVPGGGEALGLSGPVLALAIVGNLMLGMLMMLGIGLYGPCLIMVSLLGMSPIAAFPIMMGSCAFLMPTSGLTFIRRRRYSVRAALGLAIGGVPGVLIAAYIVKSLPLLYLRWLVVIVVLYTAVTLLRAAIKQPSGEGTMVP